MIIMKDISFRYSGSNHTSLENINLTIHDGECVVFCGRSGCGKTSMIRLINGLIPKFFEGEYRGKVFINGKNISEMEMYQISNQVGSVFQNPRTQFFNVDSDSEIAFGLENEGRNPNEIYERVIQSTKELGIENLNKKNIFTLSGGEKQKIAFASVYAMNPEIYLLDEPSSNLDLQSIEDLKTHLKLVKSQAKTIVIAEHRLYYLMDIVDRIVYLDEGRIKHIFTAQEFKSLSRKQRLELGLRTIDLNSEPISTQEFQYGNNTLELRNISLSYADQNILKGINLKARSGDIIAIAGKNGEGKSSLSRSICGLHKKMQGKILFNDTVQNKKICLKNSYMVMQDVNYELFAESVEKECTFGMKNPDLNLVHQSLQDLDLEQFKFQHPNTLSGGQKQRLAVTVAMISDKQVLIFDEPTSGLDLNSMQEVSNLLHQLANKNKIIFVVTHDYEFILHSCSRLIYFKNHQIYRDLKVNAENLNEIQTVFEI